MFYTRIQVITSTKTEVICVIQQTLFGTLITENFRIQKWANEEANDKYCYQCKCDITFSHAMLKMRADFKSVNFSVNVPLVLK